MALLAAGALAVTVLMTRADVEQVSEALVRGEGDRLATQLREADQASHLPPTQELLDAQLSRLHDEGLRYIGVPTPDGVLSAGVPMLNPDGLAQGSVVVRGHRALLVLPPPHPPVPHFPRDAPPPGGGPPWDGRPEVEAPEPPRAPQAASPSVVIEFEPVELPRLQAGTKRTALTGSLAALVLLGFAGVLSARAMRRAREERHGEQQRRLAAMGQMSAVMAHELRNPLTSLKGNAQLLVEMLTPGTPEHGKAALVVHESERLERLTQDLLTFVRDGELVHAEVSPRAFMDRVLARLPRERVSVDLAHAPTSLRVDEARLAVAIGNLVQNALQASPDDGGVDVRIYEVGKTVRVDVRDRGPGVPVANRERVFEPFFTTRLHGTGLGLAVARRAVEQQGGTLRVESTEGDGALFRVTLPLGEAVPARQ